MKHIKLLAFLMGILILNSCQKEFSIEEITPEASVWEFTVDTTSFGKVFTVTNFTPSQMIISGPSDDNKRLFTLTLHREEGSPITTGTYKSSLSEVQMDYMEGTERLYTANKEIGEFTVNINLLTPTLLSGTFTGKVLNKEGKVKELIRGKFSATLTPLLI